MHEPSELREEPAKGTAVMHLSTNHSATGLAALTPGKRIVAALVSTGCLGVLVVAVILKPSPTGITTHGGLGLPPCGWEAATGMPCMTCGMTTSFAWAVRGNLLASLWVQPFGTVLALLCAVVCWAGLYAAVTGRPIHRVLSMLRPRTYFIAVGVLGLGAWAWKALHPHPRDGRMALSERGNGKERRSWQTARKKSPSSSADSRRSTPLPTA